MQPVEYLVAPTRFELVISALRGRRPKPLDDGAIKENGWDGRNRTYTDGTRIRCPTVRRHPNRFLCAPQREKVIYAPSAPSASETPKCMVLHNFYSYRSVCVRRTPMGRARTRAPSFSPAGAQGGAAARGAPTPEGCAAARCGRSGARRSPRTAAARARSCRRRGPALCPSPP